MLLSKSVKNIKGEYKVRIAIYPGTFDPVTNGHLDILRRALGIFDEVVIAVALDNNKVPLFSIEERLELLTKSVQDLQRVSIKSFEGLTVAFARHCGASTILRGLRAMSDFEYEFQMALLNKKLAPDIETVFLMTDSELLFISSSLIKWAARLQGNISDFIPNHVEKLLLSKLPPHPTHAYRDPSRA